LAAVGLYVGRFQPFHLGHLEVVKLILRKVDELIIVVGSAQYSHTKNNPFTVGERIRMIRESLKEAKINLDRVQITPITDVNVHGIWVHYISLYVGKFDIVFSNDPLTSELFNEEGFRVESIPYFKREIYSSTEIRNRILANENWRELVSKSVSNIIDSIKGVERMMTLLHTDNPTI
jgi:nicotinamide-nucleotide adenylyltransferase